MRKQNNDFKLWISISLCFLICISGILYYLNHTTTSKQHSVTLTNVGFDTPITFQASCSQSEFDIYTSIVSETYIKYNQIFDQYNAYENMNNVYTLNQSAKDTWIPVDPILIDCLNKAKEISMINPQFDITQGSVLSLWHSYREQGMIANEKGKSGQIPSQEDILQAKEHTGYDKIEIKNNSIHYLDPFVQLDFGGIAKGYATQKCKEILEEKGLEQGFINAGGNVVLIGAKSSSWNIGIKSPDQEESILTYQTKEPKAIVTSGDYQRYYMADGKRYSHIINTQTGYPSNYMRSVTIITEDSTLADGLSTMLFNLSYEQGRQLIESLQSSIDIEAVWIFDPSINLNSDLENDFYCIKRTSGLQTHLSLSH